VRSRRQAMDWSLALASQGIEPTIVYSDEERCWQLLVREQDYGKACEVLRQYRNENRGWPWRPRVLEAALGFDWSCLIWVGLLVLFYWLDTIFDLRGRGMMDSAAVRSGQWWRTSTAIWLHADIGHLAANAGLGLVLLALAMARYGTMIGLFAAALTGVGGNLLALAVASRPYRSLGASGVVMGCVGLLAFPSLPGRTKREGTNETSPTGPRMALRYFLTVLGAGVMLFVLFSVSPGTDIPAHLGGFISGVIFGGLLAWLQPLDQRRSLNVWSGIGFAVEIIVPWWMALRH